MKREAESRKMEILYSILRITVAAAVGYYVFICLYLYFNQERFIFPAAPISEQQLEWTRSGILINEEVTFVASDGVKLHGWFVADTEKKKAPLVLYFGGNGEEVSSFMMYEAWFKGYSVLLVNYRGYGLSEGAPTEEDLFSDALLIYDTATAREDVDSGNVILFGRSLGSAVAVFVASKRPVAGVILVSPFDRLASVAKDAYPYLPVSLLLRHPFDSASRAPDIKTPLLALAAELDETVRLDHTINLVELWGGDKQFHLVHKRDHNSIERSAEYWLPIKEFVVGLGGEAVLKVDGEGGGQGAGAGDGGGESVEEEK